MLNSKTGTYKRSCNQYIGIVYGAVGNTHIAVGSAVYRLAIACHFARTVRSFALMLQSVYAL